MGVRSRSKSITLPRAGGGGGADLISELSDDLLVRVLEVLPDARDAVRTHALSRRWRALWTRVAVLRFDSDTRRREFREPGGPGRFVAFVDHALALRAAEKEPALEHLEISFDLSVHEEEASSDPEQLVPPSTEAAQQWIRYAMQHEVKSLTFKVDLPLPPFNGEDDGNDDFYSGNNVMTLDDLPFSSAKLETMRLNLSAVRLRLPLPSTAAFASLTDLSLENMEVGAGGGRLLGRLVSSACCPRLHRLRLVGLELAEMEEEEPPLLIDAGALLELSLLEFDELLFLQLRTPSLRVLHVKGCYELEELTVSPPRLEDVKFLVRQPLHIDGDLSSVARLEIELSSSQGYLGDDRNDGSIRLLECCSLIRCLEVSVDVPERKQQDVDIIKGSIPQLPHVASLKIHVTLRERRCSYAAGGIASLFAQCSNIRHLGLNFCYRKNDPKLDLACDNSASPSWESHELSLPHLEGAEFEKLMGTDDELHLIQFILTRASGIQKVVFSFDRKYWSKGGQDGFLLMPPLAGGSWTTWNTDANLSYNCWRRCA